MAMAPMRRLVAIGRRMKISDRCTANLVSALPAPAAAATSLIAALPARICAPITGLDASPGLEPQLSFGDDRLSGIQPLADDDVFVDPLTDRDGALLDDVIESSPEMVVNCRSSGLATADAMVFGSAPGSPALTFSVG